MDIASELLDLAPGRATGQQDSRTASLHFRDRFTWQFQDLDQRSRGRYTAAALSSAPTRVCVLPDVSLMLSPPDNHSSLYSAAKVVIYAQKLWDQPNFSSYLATRGTATTYHIYKM